jgi:hypothetical protein
LAFPERVVLVDPLERGVLLDRLVPPAPPESLDRKALQELVAEMEQMVRTVLQVEMESQATQD